MTNPDEHYETFGPCRICGELSWKADDAGPAHPCCVLHAKESPGRPCPACAASRALNREYERRQKGR